MIQVITRMKDGKPFSVRVSGHAGYAQAGEDIVCASVTSGVQLCANGITEILKEPADVLVEENVITISLPEEASRASVAFLQALQLHFSLLQQDYSQYLEILTEV